MPGRCRAAECGKQPQWQDLHWESWSAQKHHSSASSATSNSSYFCYSDSGMNYRTVSEGAAVSVHRASLGSSQDSSIRPFSDSTLPVGLLRKRSDSGGGGSVIHPFESDGGYSTPSSPSFYETPVSNKLINTAEC